MAAKVIQFPWRWDGGTISTNLDVIWGMSLKKAFQINQQINLLKWLSIEQNQVGLEMTKFRKLAIVILINVILFEIFSFFLIYSLSIIRPDLRSDLTIENLFQDITEEDLRMARTGRDDLLGWDRTPFHSQGCPARC